MPPATTAALDTDSCYRAVASRDQRFDGVFYTAVATTGIYCRPSCPARTPAVHNVSFFRTAAAAHLAGYRACKRCRPEATPGSPEWDLRADLAGRAMRLIADGVVDRDGVPGLAHRLGYTPRHLSRALTAQLGAGPLALARAHRAETARVLIESTSWSLTDIAFASGFRSVRQFNDTMRETFATTPSEFRRTVAPTPAGRLQLQIAFRTPFDASSLLQFLAARTIAGCEAVEDTYYFRSLDLPHGPAGVRIDLAANPSYTTKDGVAAVPVELSLTDLRDTATAVERVRRLLDANADPVAIAETLSRDDLLSPMVRRRPGLRVPGHVSGVEVAIRAVLGQQVSVAGARRSLTRMTESLGRPWSDPTYPQLNRLFPSAATIAALDPSELPMPALRANALIELCRRLAGAELDLDRGADRDAVREGLLSITGIGPWTADYIAMRALGHPDVVLATDIGTRDAAHRLGLTPAELLARSASWRPWRTYAQLHLWTTLTDPEDAS